LEETIKGEADNIVPQALMEDQGSKKRFSPMEKIRPYVDRQKAESVADLFGFKTNLRGGKILKGKNLYPNPSLLISSLCEELDNSSGRSLWGPSGIISNTLRREWEIRQLLVSIINDRLLPGEEPLILPGKHHQVSTSRGGSSSACRFDPRASNARGKPRLSVFWRFSR